MTNALSDSSSVWIARYSILMWIGIVLNLLIVIPLFFFTQQTLAFFGIPYLAETIWPRMAAMLLVIISAFYVPVTINFARFRPYAWLAVFPSRTFGATFFAVAVFLFNQPPGLLVMTLIDGFVGLTTLICLIKIGQREREETQAGKPAVTTTLAPRLLAWGFALLLVFALGGWFVFLRPVAQPWTNDPARIFNYGSIGNEETQGLPYWIWRVLPQMFAKYLPGRQAGYASLGLYWEPGEELPIGFAKKTIGIIPRVSPTCAFCHQGSYRLHADEPSRLVVGGPGNRVDPQDFIRFLMQAGADPDFTPDKIMQQITAIYDMPGWERLLYRFVLIPATRQALTQQAARYAWMKSRPDWGPGRIDPFNPVKFYNLRLADDGTIGNSDIVPLWDLAALTPESHYGLHWDGLSTSLEEIALAGAIGDGLTANAYVGAKDGLAQVVQFARLNQPPRSPFSSDVPQGPEFAVKPDQLARGKAIYMQSCAECHEKTGARYRQVIPAVDVGTDRHRIDMWTQEAVQRYLNYAPDYNWGFKAFQKIDGYLATELTGLWLKAPYLHNGSVPTLRDLLNGPAERPAVFYRGYDLIDAENGGFISKGPEAERVGWRYDTDVPGNGNAGHLYGVDLKPNEKDDLLAYLKTL
jgi:hypothetical protein